jgi:hypothetical protein
MPATSGSVPVDLGSIESTIQAVETQTNWRISLPARIVIQQLFVSLATDSGGFEVSMTPTVRQTALSTANGALHDFIKQCVTKSQELASQSGYAGKEVGLPVVIREVNNWATTHATCSCWPK